MEVNPASLGSTSQPDSNSPELGAANEKLDPSSEQAPVDQENGHESTSQEENGHESTSQEENGGSDKNDEDDYDPEGFLDDETKKSPKDMSKELSKAPREDSPQENQSTQSINHDNSNDEDDYNPEGSHVHDDNDDDVHDEEKDEPTKTSSTIDRSTSPSGLPPKPPVNASSPPNDPIVSDSNTQLENPQGQLKKAYETIMQSDLVKDPNFIKLSQEDQMKLIVEQLNNQNVKLTNPNDPSNQYPGMNYDQVYSFNKPCKVLKNPIPLIPVNKYCRRPNITAPMTPEEDAAYDEFIKRETYYMSLPSWDDLPDKLRLFIGNLPANTISKQDLFRIFSQYGEVVQIAIKAGYGFAQFKSNEACAECIKGETDVPLHNKIMRLDSSKPQKARKSANDTNRGKRSFEDRLEDIEYSPKKSKFVPDCQVYITGKSSIFFIRKVKKAFSNSPVSINIQDITHQDLSSVISEAAYSGVLGTCVIKEMKVDVQTFEKTPDGGIKFDEYADIEPEVAADILMKSKMKVSGNNSFQPGAFPSNQTSNGFERGGRDRGGRDRDRDRDRGGRDRRGGPRGGRNFNDRGGGRGDGFGGGRGGRDHRGNQSNHRWPNDEWNANSYPSNQYHRNTGPSHSGPPPQQVFQNNAPYGGSGYPNAQQSYGQGYPQPPPPGQAPLDSGLVQTLQNMDPASMQNMISLLQQLQQQQQHNQQYSQSYGNGYNQPYNQGPPPPSIPQGQSPSNQVNNLLSQLQSSQANASYNHTMAPGFTPPQQQQQPQNSTQSLMETLARLSKN
ncbi:hypothetical protein HYPBUDRAFT_13379 [Hyphopichia burtonii NRRL Y-1933]|uniref:RRM domain-containing protein n=1 Tax=Hyphopichia burtonii NRRL Y-1933 TaxID=984485 RepID=A0A1E4RD98_9ASCO|nr:hypothetical protein HYPBUDRAFT_13379 [Hyphopichia burtonii NRRL Y-1933]ODV65220.1 hypothetical protein HYPBUDRAFT_13379 [Hyphopichia burtonii NRRL Y-1933]